MYRESGATPVKGRGSLSYKYASTVTAIEKVMRKTENMVLFPYLPEELRLKYCPKGCNTVLSTEVHRECGGTQCLRLQP
jgi:hypothetical protein